MLQRIINLKCLNQKKKRRPCSYGQRPSVFMASATLPTPRMSALFLMSDFSFFEMSYTSLRALLASGIDVKRCRNRFWVSRN